MSLLNTLHSLWSSWSDAASPRVNTDGTPMLNDAIDVMGKPFGAMDCSAHDWSTGVDMGTFGSDPWDSGCGGSDGSNGFGDSF